MIDGSKTTPDRPVKQGAGDHKSALLVSAY
jgi:hypothetical protein